MTVQELCQKFFSVPEENLTQELCDKYFELVQNIHRQIVGIIKENPEKRGELLNKYAQLEVGLNKIPKEMRTPRMCIKYFQEHKRDFNVFSFIPEDKRTPYMYYEYFMMHKDEEEVFMNIPEEYRTDEMYKEMYQNYFNRHNQNHSKTLFMDNIPEEYRTDDMYLAFFEVRIHRSDVFDLIPRDRITSHMILRYFQANRRTRYYGLSDFPDELITQEIIDEYNKTYEVKKRKPKLIDTQRKANNYFKKSKGYFRVFSIIPKEFITADMVREFYEYNKRGVHGSSILCYIPNEFITTDMVREFFEKHKNDIKVLFSIPNEFITADMVREFFDINKNSAASIRFVPYAFIDEDVLRKYLEDHNESITLLRMIPTNFITADMVSELFEINKKYLYVLDEIPNKFITDDMAKEFFEIHKNNIEVLEHIPDSYINDEMAIEFFEIHKNNLEVLKYIPVDKITKDMTLAVDVSVYPLELKNQLLYKELMWLKEDGGTLENLGSRYDVTSTVLNSIIDYIKVNDEDAFTEIKAVLNENSNRHIQAIYAGLEKVNDLLKFIGYRTYKNITKKQKIEFATLLPDLHIHISLFEMYNFVRKNKDLKSKYPLFVSFSRKVLNYEYVAMKKEKNIAMYDDEKLKADMNDKWLRSYNTDYEFADERYLTLRYLDKNGMPVEITKDIADDIISCLKKNNIPTSSVIVIEAFRRYALDEFADYIIELEERRNDFKNPNTKKRVKVKK